MKRSLVLGALASITLSAGTAAACWPRPWFVARPVYAPAYCAPQTVLVCPPTPICPPSAAAPSPLHTPKVTMEPAIESTNPMKAAGSSDTQPFKPMPLKTVDLAIPAPATPTPDPTAPPPAPKATETPSIPKPADPPKAQTPPETGTPVLPAPKPLQIPTESPTSPPKIPPLKPPVPGANDPTIPPLSIPNIPAPTKREANSSPIAAELSSPQVEVYPVEGAIESPTTKRRIQFFNHTDRDVKLTVLSETVTLPARHRITAAVPAKFTWELDGGDRRNVEVPLTAPGVDIVLRTAAR